MAVSSALNHIPIPASDISEQDENIFFANKHQQLTSPIDNQVKLSGRELIPDAEEPSQDKNKLIFQLHFLITNLELDSWLLPLSIHIKKTIKCL